jgi:hypothetical protein
MAGAQGGGNFLQNLPNMLSAGQGVMGGQQQPQQAPGAQNRQGSPMSFAPSSYQPQASGQNDQIMQLLQYLKKMQGGGQMGGQFGQGGFQG